MLARVVIILVLLTPLPAAAEEVYQTSGDFLAETFDGDVPAPAFLWIRGDMRPIINRIFQHAAFRSLRVRYWRYGGRTVWILEEIGKYQPITTGIVVNDGALERIKILIYRESHGWEVRHDFFTDQFKGLTLDDRYRLSGSVDGISGATLSVSALKNLARLALYFHETVTAKDP